MNLVLRACLLAFCLAVTASPAAAQWTRVTALPEDDVFSVWANGDTITAGTDTALYVSTNAGATWKQSVRVAPGVTSVSVALFRNGRLYAGTSGQGVFVSDDLGDSWLGYNQGLVGGIGNAQLFLKDLLIRGDSLYAATSGAGAWVRNLNGAGNWIPFGNAFEANHAANMNDLAAGGSRLVACGGFNGTTFFRDPGAFDWTLSWLDNVGAAPGLAALKAVWTGTGWIVGSNSGIFTSPLGQSPWAFVDLGLGTLFTTAFAPRGHDVFACFGNGGTCLIAFTQDDGASWQELETLNQVFTYDMTRCGTDLFAGRLDGLWRRSIATVSVPEQRAGAGLRFALVGPQPVGETVRFRFELAAPGRAAIEVYDVAGRRTGPRIDGSFPAGANELTLDARGLRPGIYWARLVAGGSREALRLVKGGR